MQTVFPDYYKDFHCIAGACRHSCCAGWEIDIDPDTLAFYQTVPDEMGKRLRENISREGDPHFLLVEGERCPFLNRENLCDIILTLGEEHLCGICADHPRFRNELPGRVETGLGLCCEEAARLILSRKAPLTLEITGEAAQEDAIIALRDRLLLLLQDRSRSIPWRAQALLDACGAVLPDWTIARWAETFLALERLDEQWTGVLHFLRENGDRADFPGFDRCMAQRQEEYEQLLAYFIYRHFSNAPDLTEAAARAAFAVLAYRLLYTAGCAVWTKTGSFPFRQQTELARLFSSEIEYSEENLSALLDLLWEFQP